MNRQLFADLSSTIVLKDRGFVSVSSSVNDRTVEMKAEDGGISSVSWILLYRASLSGYRAADFHQACDGMGKCVVVAKAENGRIVAAYNEDGFTSIKFGRSPNHKGFIACVADAGDCGEIYHRNDNEGGVGNHPTIGPVFGSFLYDLCISDNCRQTDKSCSSLGVSYGSRPSVNGSTLFGQESFRVFDYEVFKIVIE
jgi:hypothetical protein